MIIIFDLDGTLANTDYRSHFVEGLVKDWASFYAGCVYDLPNEGVAAIFRALMATGEHHIEIWTGRPDAWWNETVTWLEQFNLVPHRLRMRPEGEDRSDYILKGDWLDEWNDLDEKPVLCFDDRTRSVAWWRSRGLECLQVSQHDF